MASRDVRRTGIDKLTVHFIRKKIQIVLLHQIANLIHLTARIEVSRGVIRIANQNGPRTFVNQLLELLDLRQRKSFFYRSGYRTDDRSRRNGKCHVIGVCRFGNDDFVARIQAGQKSEQHSLRTSRRDDDVVRRKIDMIFGIISDQLFPVTQISLARAVFQNRPVDITDGIYGRSRSRQIRLADIQMVHMYPSIFSLEGQRSQLANRRLRHFLTANGYFRHVFSFLFLFVRNSCKDSIST